MKLPRKLTSGKLLAWVQAAELEGVIEIAKDAALSPPALTALTAQE